MNPNFNGAMFPFAQPNQVQNENNIHAIHRPVQYKNGVGMNGPSVYHVQPSCVNVPFQNLGGFCASGQVTQQQQQQARALNDVTNLHYNMRTTQPEQSRFSFFTKGPVPQQQSVPAQGTQSSHVSSVSSTTTPQALFDQQRLQLAPAFSHPVGNDTLSEEDEDLDEDEGYSDYDFDDEEEEEEENEFMDHSPPMSAQESVAAEIFAHLKDTEGQLKPNSDYMERIQTDISHVMRAILVDWLFEVAREFSLRPETLYLAVNILDRYLARVVIGRGRLQLVGVTSLLIAAKYFEMDCPSVDDLVYITDNTYTREEIPRMEIMILNALSFDVTVVTTYDFLERFLKVVGANKIVSDMANFLSELTLQKYNMLGFLPSVVAASCVVVALFVMNSHHWPLALKQVAGVSVHELKHCIAQVLRVFQDVGGSNLSAIKEKFSGQDMSCVSRYTCFRPFEYATIF